MEKKIGFIGCGNMGSAMIGGMTGAGRTGEEKASAMVPADQVMASCASETSAREKAGALGIEVTTDNRKVAEFADKVVAIPDTIDFIAPITSIVPMQIFAYYMSVQKGCDVDKPRNLAKSVTVE